MAGQSSLERFPEDDLRRVLCVVAHPDDMEYGASAAIARWTRRGVEVGYVLLTRGEAGMQRTPAEAAAVRATEQRAACDLVGVADLTILDHPDGVLEHTLALRRDIARQIRRFQPDAVVTGAWDVEAPWGLNQADHRVAGLATLDAVRDADNRWVFPELAEVEGLERWGATWLLVTGSAAPTHAVEVEAEAVAAAVASLAAHAAYLADLPDHPAPDAFIPEMLHAAGPAIGADAAVAFRAHRLRG